MAGKSSPEAMDEMIRNMTKFMTVQQGLIQSIKNDYAAVGQEWNDKQYENLGVVIDQIISSISSTYTTLSESTTRLQLLKRKLEEYLSQQF